ncbi:hypothetical protein [Thiomicrorhabdus sp.]|uniref:hypothetical protein n=1 Tax=Thiomicrorhabdus sp. TaxID=2039724 RepID=UPI002AA8363B|nr:hypothetical protein [Thiomicrorhabdus sp.]
MSIHPSLDNQMLSEEHCFLCGAEANDMTEEHVMPKWLLKSSGLWDKRLTLLNGTSIPYRLLKVPCCSSCNNEHLSRLEMIIRGAFEEGYSTAIKIDKELWFLWAAKVIYGILRKEFSLLADRSLSGSESIMSEEDIRSFSHLHLFMQSIIGRHKFGDSVPYTVLICKLHDLGEELNFDFRDSLYQKTFLIRVGEVGIIVSLEDGELIKETFGRYVDEVNGRSLHPLQFDELYAKVKYQVSLLDSPLRFLTISPANGVGEVITSVIGSQYVSQWNQEDYSRVLELELEPWVKRGVIKKIEFVPPDKVPSWMVDSLGNILILNKDDCVSA